MELTTSTDPAASPLDFGRVTGLVAAKAGDVVQPNDATLDDLFLGEKVPLEAIIEPDRWNIVIKQIGIKKKVGSIYIPLEAQDAQSYTHGMAVVVKVGPSVYRGRKFEELNLTPDDGPKPGNIVYFEARMPRRLKIDGEEYLIIPDDAVIGRFDRKHINRVSFTIGS